MKVKVPIELDVDLEPNQICQSIKDWIYPILRKYQEIEWGSLDLQAIVKQDKLFWRYRKCIGDTCTTETLYKEITISDKKIFNLCKSGIELLNAYKDVA